ncbi:MAG: sigma-70 family RNA polymerase sigma factor [Labilithrix sp.]|nr:sigma-70 family RNA polymerase sigma factor [Labilithrix sp.]
MSPLDFGQPERSAAIVRRAAEEGTSARVERLIQEHYEFVWRSARRLGVRSADLDDVVQEVFVVAARRLDDITHELGFLFRACMHAAAHSRRSVQRRREVLDERRLAHEIDRRANPEQDAETAEARAQLQAVIEEMPEDLRAVFVLFELERFTMSEIAETLSVPSGTVASRLRRAREAFFARVAERE